MGALSFRLPAGMNAAAVRDLERASVAGGYDSMPALCRVAVANNQLVITRDPDDSAMLVAPSDVGSQGLFMGTSATLVQRAEPYNFNIELARGKVNQLRCQSNDWSYSGMTMSDELNQRIRTVSQRFSRMISLPPGTACDTEAGQVLFDGYAAAQALVGDYMDQLLQIRTTRQGPLESSIGFRANGAINTAHSAELAASINHLTVPMCWRHVEPIESQYQWEATEAALKWAEANRLQVSAGPLIDLSPRGLPDWLWLWQGDLQSLASFMCDYVETAVAKYRGRIRRWVLSAAANVVGILKLGEEDLLWLTARLAEAAWQIDPELELVISVTQPWGEYMARRDYTYSPFIFADTLIRAGLKLAALELEWFMGVTPRGSYCRDALDASRQLDLYALLGLPLQIALAYPSAETADAQADSSNTAGAGHWRAGFNPQAQSEWAATFAKLAISKPFVRGVAWAHLTDQDEHLLPHCGLIDAAGQPKPALAQLKKIKSDYLK